MPWTKGVLLLMMAVMSFSSSMAGPEAFSKTGANGAVSGDTIHFGKLLIGGQSAAFDDKKGSSKLGSAEQSSEDERFRLARAKLQRLGPSLQCGNDSMTLNIKGHRTPHFLVERGEGSPVSLSEMPASCGFSLKRIRRDVSLVAPYTGCNVRQQGGSYVLPLIIMGAPVQMSCPVSPRLPVVSCTSSEMIISFGVRSDDVLVKVSGSWMPLPLTSSMCSFTLDSVGGSMVLTAPFTGSCWDSQDTDWNLPLLLGDREVVLSCPKTTESTPTVPPTLFPLGYPYFQFGYPWWYPNWNQAPAAPPTTPAPVQAPVYNPFPMYYPYYYGGFPPRRRHHHRHWYPESQESWYPMLPPYEFAQFQPTPPPTTTAAPQIQQYPFFPMPFNSGFKNPFWPQVAQSVSNPQSLSSPLSIYWSRKQKK
ncbi:uncharacterized protein LOC130237425 isoform X2 [Danio aesculapii]|uniref:uncharacterized protein LOC130237425 isoform X2 n=1 Tax=Danio aesculapii TaxID=1142201 RepID=UPI0024BF91C4|nr:uncharacterized protein LOC130237425 isoform X2 [Danio aesculapii]